MTKFLEDFNCEPEVKLPVLVDLIGKEGRVIWVTYLALAHIQEIRNYWPLWEILNSTERQRWRSCRKKLELYDRRWSEWEKKWEDTSNWWKDDEMRTGKDWCCVMAWVVPFAGGLINLTSRRGRLSNVKCYI